MQNNEKISKKSRFIIFIKNYWYQLIMIGLIIYGLNILNDIKKNIGYIDSTGYYDQDILYKLESIDDRLIK